MILVQYGDLWQAPNTIKRVSSLWRHRPLCLACCHGILCSALVIGLYGCTVPVVAESRSTPLLAAFDEVLQPVVSLRRLQPKTPIQRAVRNRQQIRTAV